MAVGKKADSECSVVDGEGIMTSSYFHVSYAPAVPG